METENEYAVVKLESGEWAVMSTPDQRVNVIPLHTEGIRFWIVIASYPELPEAIRHAKRARSNQQLSMSK